MNQPTARRKAFTRRKRFLLFVTGAVLGSAVGVVIGALFTYWFGEETVRVVKREVRRLLGRADRPDFNLLME